MIEIRLKWVLEQYGLDKRGVIQEIARYTKCHRHTIRKLYHSKTKALSLRVLGRVCDWLEKNDVPAEVLPGALLGRRPSRLWAAITKPGAVGIYLGEYQQAVTPEMVRQWVSSRDAAVATDCSYFLSLPDNVDGDRPAVDVHYVPFRFTRTPQKVAKKEFHEDIARAKRIFGHLMSREPYGSAILVGSQRVNYLTELLVSDLFGCKPFVRPRGSKRVPFYLVYRSEERAVPSCFGGLEKPPGWRKGEAAPGLYYRKEPDRWEACPFVPHKKCSGMVIVRYDGRVKAMEMAVFGYSGRATAVMGQLVRNEPDRFWPPYATLKNRTVGVYVCRFELTGNGPCDAGSFREDSVEVVRIKRSVLEGHASQSRRRAPYRQSRASAAKKTAAAAKS